MTSIAKHEFEAVSLLTVHNGQLDVSILPVADRLDWIVPSNLILDTVPYESEGLEKTADKKSSNQKKSQEEVADEQKVKTFYWNEQQLPIYCLCSEQQIEDESATKSVVVLEGSDDEHRIAVVVEGEINALNVGIKDVKDVEDSSEGINAEKDEISEKDAQSVSTIYQLQKVSIKETIYTVPDLDELAYQLTSA